MVIVECVFDYGVGGGDTEVGVSSGCGVAASNNAASREIGDIGGPLARCYSYDAANVFSGWQ